MRKLAILAVSISLLTSGSAVLGATGRMPSGSYLRKPVSSVNELAAQIGKDPVVRKEFARHFGVRPSNLQSYIRDNVVIVRVTSNTSKRVYFIRRNGRMVAERRTLPKGTAVFALKDTGEPLLVAVCGNPVLKRLPPREKVKAEAPQTYQLLRPAEAALPPPPVVAGVVAAPEAIVPLPPPTLGAPPPIPPPVTAPPIVAVAKKGSFLPLLGGLFVHHGHHGVTPPPPPIPEPGGAAAVAATGLLPAAGWAIRRLRYRGGAA